MLSTTLSRILMVIALSSLGAHRADWGQAMLAEFQTALAARRPLSCSARCLIAAWRDMPAHREGRMTLARYALALLLLLPLAAVLLHGVATGYPFLGILSFLSPEQAAASGWSGPVNNSNLSAVKVLTLLILSLSVRHLVVAWFVVERDWARVGMAQRFGAAVITTLAMFAGVIVREESCLILPVATLTIELLATVAVARYHNVREHPPTGHWSDVPAREPELIES